ncbi:MAG: DUF5050 domain-containing protein [Nanoarchaeota archaeon]
MKLEELLTVGVLVASVSACNKDNGVFGQNTSSSSAGTTVVGGNAGTGGSAGYAGNGGDAGYGGNVGGSSCVNDCDATGLKTCDGETAWKQCGNYDADPCLDWSSKNECGSYEVCNDDPVNGAECVLTCTDECTTEGEKVCDGDTAWKQCGKYDADPCLELSSSTSCGLDEVCKGDGECVSTIPVVLASNQDKPLQIVVDANHVFWTNNSSNGDVKRIGIDGSNQTTLASGLNYPTGIAIDNTDVYYAVQVSGKIMKVSKNGGNSTELAIGQSNPYNVMIDSGFLYWTNNIPSSIMKMPTNGGNVNTLYSGMPDVSLDGIASDTTNLYWTNYTEHKIMTGPKNGGNPTELASAQSSPISIAVDATDIYLANNGNDTIMKMPIGGGNQVTLASGQGNPRNIVIDTTNVYWTSEGNGEIGRVSKNGQNLTILATGEPKPYYLTVDSTSVYWTNRISGGNVMKVAK